MTLSKNIVLESGDDVEPGEVEIFRQGGVGSRRLYDGKGSAVEVFKAGGRQDMGVQEVSVAGDRELKNRRTSLLFRVRFGRVFPLTFDLFPQVVQVINILPA